MALHTFRSWWWSFPFQDRGICPKDLSFLIRTPQFLIHHNYIWIAFASYLLWNLSFSSLGWRLVDLRWLSRCCSEVTAAVVADVSSFLVKCCCYCDFHSGRMKNILNYLLFLVLDFPQHCIDQYLRPPDHCGFLESKRS